MDRISDEVLKQIAEGTGRTYPHEGKQMARELIERRAAKPEPAPSPPLDANYPWSFHD